MRKLVKKCKIELTRWSFKEKKIIN